MKTSDKAYEVYEKVFIYDMEEVMCLLLAATGSELDPRTYSCEDGELRIMTTRKEPLGTHERNISYGIRKEG